MEKDGSKVEYRSADIKKKDGGELLTNVTKKKNSKQISEQQSRNRWIFTLVAAFVIIGGSVAAALIANHYNDKKQPTEDDWATQLEQLNREISEAAFVQGGGDNYFNGLARLDDFLAKAEASGDKNRVIDVELLKAQFIANAGDPRLGITDTLAPLLDTPLNQAQRIRVLNSAFWMAQMIPDSEVTLIYARQLLDIYSRIDLSDIDFEIFSMIQAYLINYIDITGDTDTYQDLQQRLDDLLPTIVQGGGE